MLLITGLAGAGLFAFAFVVVEFGVDALIGCDCGLAVAAPFEGGRA